MRLEPTYAERAPPVASGASIAVCGAAVAAGTETAIKKTGEALDQPRQASAPRLAPLFLLAGQPRHLDHPALALARQVAVNGIVGARSEERRVGTECVSTCSDCWWPDLKKKNNK